MQRKGWEATQNGAQTDSQTDRWTLVLPTKSGEIGGKKEHKHTHFIALLL